MLIDCFIADEIACHFFCFSAGCIFRVVPVRPKISAEVLVAPRCASVSSTAPNGCMFVFLVSNFKVLSTCCRMHSV